MELNIDTLDMHFVDRSFDLIKWTDAIGENVKALGGVSLIEIDTSPVFYAVCGFPDENSNVQATTFARALRSLTEFSEHRPSSRSCTR